MIQPPVEQIEIVIPRTAEVRKELKLEPPQRQVKSRMVALLKEHVDIFAWSCQDTPGSNTDIVAHKLPRREDCPLEKQGADAAYQGDFVS